MATWRYPNIEQNPRQVAIDQPTPVYKYIRSNFIDAGVDNFANPPAQDPMMMMQLTNVQPIVDGTINRRWGYSLWNPSLTAAAAQLIDYQSDLTGARNIIATTLSGSQPVTAYNDDGSIFNSSIFQNTGGPQPLRAVSSRNYAYFSDGQLSNFKKWDGKSTSVATNWGIDSTNATISSSGSAGPNNAGAASDLGTPSGNQPTSQGPNAVGTGADNGGGLDAWQSPSNLPTTGTDVHVNASDSASGLSDYLLATNFSFNLPSNTVSVDGISITISWDQSGVGVSDNSIKIIQGGTISGTEHALGAAIPISNPGNTTYGNSTDKWGLSWAYTDINSANFGLAIQVIENNGVATLANVFAVTITVYYTIPGSTFSWTNPTNVEGNSAYATATAAPSGTSNIRANTYGFTLSSGWSVTGIQVNITCFATGGTNPRIQVALDKSSTQYTAYSSVAMPSSATAVSLGGPGNLWGGTWALSDISGSAGFGVELNCITTSGSSAVSVKNVTVTIYYAQSTLSVATSGTGITLNSGRIYTVCFTNINTGHISNLYTNAQGPVYSASTGALSNQGISLTNIPVANDIQVTHVIILATADGGDESRLYFLAEITNGTTSYSDTTPEVILLANNVYLSTDAQGNEFGVSFNDPPAKLSNAQATGAAMFPIKHRGNLYMTIGPTLFWSKALSDVTTDTGFVAGKWEESWPETNQLDVSELAESVRGLISDGINLYLGTEFKIRRLNGSAPYEEPPDIVHNQVGLMNQDVWKIVYAMGTPVGSIWLTPDLRIILSDFNTYQDVSVPIQTTLQTINTSVVASTAFAAFYSNGPYDLYFLAIPTGTNTSNDTLLIFNIQTQKWFVWKLADQVTCMTYHIKVNGQSSFIFGAASKDIYQLTPNSTQDRIGNTPTTYAVTAQTSWLDLTEPTLRKTLNEIELLTDDSTMTITVEGASLHGEFNNPNTVVSNAGLTKGPFGNYKLYLAGKPGRDRYYRLTMTSPAGNVSNVLESFNIEAVPMNRL